MPNKAVLRTATTPPASDPPRLHRSQTGQLLDRVAGNGREQNSGR